MAHGNGDSEIFQRDEDQRVFLGMLEVVARRTDCKVLTYCLMSTHFHLLLQVGRLPLGKIMQRLLTRYANWFNHVHARRGHLFQSRYLAKLCLDEIYLLTLLRYIHLNPVTAGMVMEAGLWDWSSHNQFTGPIRSCVLDLDRALRLLGDTPAAARRRYAALLEEPLGDFTPNFDFEEEIFAPQPPGEEPPTLGRISMGFKSDCGASIETISGRIRRCAIAALRKEFSLKAAEYGYSNAEIAAFLGVHPTTVGLYLSVRP